MNQNKIFNFKFLILNYGAAAFFLSAPVIGAGVAGDTGTSWLKIPSSAQAAGMAGAYSAVGTDVSALGINPAGLGLIDGPQGFFMHDLWIQNMSTEHLAYGQGLDGQSGGAASLDFTNFGGVDLYTLSPSGTPVSAGTYSPFAGNLTLGYGRKVAENFWAGGSAKFLLQSLDATNTGATAAVDLGALYRLPNNGLSFALVISNLGGTLSNASLPAQVRLGAAYQKEFGQEAKDSDDVTAHPAVSHLVTLAADGNVSVVQADPSSFSIGGEYWYNHQVAARLGYRFSSYGTLNGLAGFCAGVGVKYQKFELSYALTTLGDLGASHQISLGMRF